MEERVLDEPGDIFVEGARVIVHCRDVRLTLAPDVAVITSDRLLRAGLAAKRNETESILDDPLSRSTRGREEAKD